MRISHFATAPRVGGSPHRPGGIRFVNLLEGTPFARDNYLLTIVDIEDEFFTPRHRHNFEQVRIMLNGSMSFGADQVQQAGSVGYFCEGTYYTQKGVGASRTLLLQVGGPSGSGYMNRAQMDAGIANLQNKGHFEQGVFSWIDETGQKQNRDGYEAAWEQVFGRPISYEPPRYDAPLIMWPDRFAYVPDLGEGGVASKPLGRFNERGLDIAQLRLAAGARYVAADAGQHRLFFVIDGNGDANGQSFERYAAIEVPRDAAVTLTAASELELYVIGLPRFET